ncbi:hypothetical protein HKX48_009562 [Thoreauomyces humboldtii]|nr:hypothetical protein HKX48_009562 [Thoreauomyces humboldtii]
MYQATSAAIASHSPNSARNLATASTSSDPRHKAKLAAWLAKRRKNALLHAAEETGRTDLSHAPRAHSQDNVVKPQLGLLGNEAEITFRTLGVPAGISRALQDVFKATVPSESQRAFLPVALSHSDIFLKDVTGTGKSLGLVTAVLSKPQPTLSLPTPSGKLHSQRYINTLIMVPTRELAIQLTTWIRDLSQKVKPEDYAKLVQCCINGVEEDRQAEQLKETVPRILIGTPVRLLALYERKAFDASRIQMLVLDEVDRLVTANERYGTVNVRFKRLVHPLAGETLLAKLIADRTAAMKDATRTRSTGRTGYRKAHVVKNDPTLDPAARRMQVIACSATLNNPLRRDLAKFKAWLKDPVLLDMKGRTTTPSGIKHRCLVFNEMGASSLLQQTGDLEDFTSESLSGMPSLLDPTCSAPENTHVKNKEADTSSPPSSPPSTPRVHAPALPDASDAILETIARICHDEDVTSGLVFVHSSVSQQDLVDRLGELGLKPERLMNFVDYERHTMTESSSSPPPPWDDAVAEAEEGDSEPHSDEDVVGIDGGVRSGGDVYDATQSPIARYKGHGTPRPFATFLSGQRRLMVLTEYEARGLDLPNATHVFVLGPPSSPASYVHMAGRTGRNGREGQAIVLVGGSRFEDRMKGLYHLLRIKLESGK